MEQGIGIIRAFETENFRVVVDALPEDDLDLSWDEDGETARKLESGLLVAFVARARVILKETGEELAADYLGGCVHEDLDAFQDHRQCAAYTRKLIRQNGRFQIYRKARPYPSCLSNSDKLKKRGFATRERAEAWAAANAKEPYEIFETGVCGSYFAGMVSEVVKDARKRFAEVQATVCGIRLREAL
jgi:hypothetical protein